MKPLLVERALPGDDASNTNRPARSVSVNLAESPLTWLHARKLLSDRQYAAGELLRRDYERAQLGPSVTMNWEAAPPGKSRRGPTAAGTATHNQVAAKARFHSAIEGVGPGLSDIVWRVICAGEGLPSSEKALGWPSRSGKLVLGLALDRVADYYQVP
jgi:Domain of unknown function (DUF6456)